LRLGDRFNGMFNAFIDDTEKPLENVTLGPYKKTQTVSFNQTEIEKIYSKPERVLFLDRVVLANLMWMNYVFSPQKTNAQSLSVLPVPFVLPHLFIDDTMKYAWFMPHQTTWNPMNTKPKPWHIVLLLILLKTLLEAGVVLDCDEKAFMLNLVMIEPCSKHFSSSNPLFVCFLLGETTYSLRIPPMVSCPSIWLYNVRPREEGDENVEKLYTDIIKKIDNSFKGETLSACLLECLKCVNLLEEQKVQEIYAHTALSECVSLPLPGNPMLNPLFVQNPLKQNEFKNDGGFLAQLCTKVTTCAFQHLLNGLPFESCPTIIEEVTDEREVVAHTVTKSSTSVVQASVTMALNGTDLSQTGIHLVYVVDSLKMVQQVLQTLGYKPLLTEDQSYYVKLINKNKCTSDIAKWFSNFYEKPSEHKTIGDLKNFLNNS